MCFGFLAIFSSIASSDTTYNLIWTGTGADVAHGTVTFNSLAAFTPFTPASSVGISNFSLTIGPTILSMADFTGFIRISDPINPSLTTNIKNLFADFNVFGVRANGQTTFIFTDTQNDELFTLQSIILAGPSSTDTQIALQANASAIQGVYALQTGTINNSLNYDCTNFGSNGFCFSAGGRYSNASISDANATSAMIIGGYRVNENIRVGGYIDQNLYNTDVAGIASLRSNMPLLGIFAVLNKNTDKTGFEAKLSAGYNNSSLYMSRNVIGTSEAGVGSAEMDTLAESAILSYGFRVHDNWLAGPYAGVRHTSVSMGGYTEQASTSVTAPLTYNALSQESTTAMLGLKFSGQVYNRTTLQASAGFEQDMHNAVSNYTASGITGLTPITFNPDIQRTRAVTSFGAYYDLGGDQRIGFNGIYRQESFQNVDTKMAYVSYSKGF